MEVSISEEQDQLIRLATSSGLKLLFETGNVLPTVFAYNGGQVQCFTLMPDSLDALRSTVRTTLRETCPHARAYAFAYDASIERDGLANDALIVESADAEDGAAFEFAVLYDRTKQTHESMRYVGKSDSLLLAQPVK